MTIDPSSKPSNYRIPAEWEKRSQTLISWPIRKEIWPKGIETIQRVYAEVAKIISQFESVSIIVHPDHYQNAVKLCSPRINFLKIDHDDSWIRDNGPVFIFNEQNEILGIDWRFNAWGEKYFPYNKDDALPQVLLDIFNIKRIEAPFILEGGSINTDGEGTLLVTEECLLNPNRNQGITKEEFTQILNRFMGIEKIIWIPKGLYGDETDGHIDNIACFIRPSEVLVQICNDPRDPNYKITHDCVNILNNSTDAKQRQLKVHTVEQPKKRIYRNKRLTLSYINFYFINNGLILPQFGQFTRRTDEMALHKFTELFFDRKVIPFKSLEIVKGGGNIHCITLPIPEAI